MNDKKIIILRIIIILILSFLLFLIFSVREGLFLFVILLNLGALIDIIQLLVRRKFRILMCMFIFYILLIGVYYNLIDSGILR